MTESSNFEHGLAPEVPVTWRQTVL